LPRPSRACAYWHNRLIRIYGLVMLAL
jgi:hypothetical protein